MFFSAGADELACQLSPCHFFFGTRERFVGQRKAARLLSRMRVSLANASARILWVALSVLISNNQVSSSNKNMGGLHLLSEQHRSLQLQAVEAVHPVGTNFSWRGLQRLALAPRHSVNSACLIKNSSLLFHCNKINERKKRWNTEGSLLFYSQK